jgi:hypothetical protein
MDIFPPRSAYFENMIKRSYVGISMGIALPILIKGSEVKGEDY